MLTRVSGSAPGAARVLSDQVTPEFGTTKANRPIAAAPRESTNTAPGRVGLVSRTSADRFEPRPVPPRSMRRTGRPKSKLPAWLPWVVFVLIISALAIGLANWRHEDAAELPYSEFRREVVAGRVATLVIDNRSGRIIGEWKTGGRFESTGPTVLSDTDVDLFESRTQVSYAAAQAAQPWTIWVGPVVLGLGALALAGLALRTRRQSNAGLLSLGPDRRRVWTNERPATSFDDVAGFDEVKAELREVVDFLRDPSRFRAMGAHVPKGVLLVGPPGTGKTLFARAIAGEAGVSFVSASGSDFMEMLVGVGAARVRDLFSTARRTTPCIVFIDEIDSLGRRRPDVAVGGSDERDQTLNQLLSEMDGFETFDGVVVIAATNRPDVLDSALTRPGRFDRQVAVPLPSREERRAILEVHTRAKPLADDVDLDAWAAGTPGMSGAELANLVNEAALGAVRRKSEHITTDDLDAARDRVVMGAARSTLALSSDERRTTAIHEAGHALLAQLVDHADPVHKVTIIPRGRALGATVQLPETDRLVMNRSQLLDRVAVLLGGRAAEQVALGSTSTGASDDLATATALARRMVGEWGMSERVGPAAWGTGGASDVTARILDEEVEVLLRDEDNRAVQLLSEHRIALNALADRLLEVETIDGSEVAELAGRK